jgi:hypothetical protein
MTEPLRLHPADLDALVRAVVSAVEERFDELVERPVSPWISGP